MSCNANTATLGGHYVRIYHGDDALVRDDADALKVALDRFHETGDGVHIAPFIKPNGKPTRFQLRHLRGRAAAELDSILAETLTSDHAPTIRTATTMAHLCLSPRLDGGIEGWDGPELKWRMHEHYPFRVLTDDAFDALCDVAGGDLVVWLGTEAFKARALRPL